MCEGLTFDNFFIVGECVQSNLIALSGAEGAVSGDLPEKVPFQLNRVMRNNEEVEISFNFSASC